MQCLKDMQCVEAEREVKPMESHSGTPAPDDRRVTHVHDAQNRLSVPSERDHCFETTTYNYCVEALAATLIFVHDKHHS
jgi:hypothetical protein